MLAYITIGTNDFQRSVDFYEAIFKVLGYSRLPAWTESWAMWGMKITHMRYSTSVFVLLLTGIPQRRETGQCSHSMQTALTLSGGFMQQASLREGRMKASQGHEPHTAPTFMLPICAILTGISWHAFVSIILLKQISS
jgi:hypothetical protein